MRNPSCEDIHDALKVHIFRPSRTPATVTCLISNLKLLMYIRVDATLLCHACAVT